VAYAEVHQKEGFICYYDYRTLRLTGYSQTAHALRIDQYVLQNGRMVLVGYDTVMSDRVLHFHRSGAWIGETSTDKKTPRGASSGSAQVMAAQERLDKLGFSPGAIDGILGPRTRAALRQYQDASGLPVTGRLDAATFRALGIETRTQ
jgi:hypothetical protein